ncbi:MAG: hypothetical protein QM775_34670 [Pirellulales bacterium]
MEVLLGNVPGIIKQVAINYYGRSLMYDAGVDHGLSASDTQWLDPYPAYDARIGALDDHRGNARRRLAGISHARI